MCVCVCRREGGRQRENSYVGSEALRLSYLISLIRTQTITVPWLSPPRSFLSSHHLLAFLTARHNNSSLLHFNTYSVFPPLSSHLKYPIYPSIHSSRKLWGGANPQCKLHSLYIYIHISGFIRAECHVGWLQSLVLINQTGPLRGGCFEYREVQWGGPNGWDQTVGIYLKQFS